MFMLNLLFGRLSYQCFAEELKALPAN